MFGMSVQKDCKLPPLPVSERQGLPVNCPGGSEKPVRKSRQQSDEIGSLFTLKTAHGAGATGFLSTWPAHVSSQIVHQGHRQPPGSENRIRGCGEELSGLVSKPRFLEQLESYLRRELQALDSSQLDAPERRLQAYQEVFQYFIEDLKTYKPLLSAIKNEYEIALAHLREQIRTLEPLKGMLVVVSEQCDQRVLALREEERAEVKALKQEKSHLLMIIDNMNESKNALQAQVSRLQEDLAAQYLLYREESDARKLLVNDISNMRYLQEEHKSPEQEVEEQEDAVRVRLALKVAREDLTRLQVELNRMQAEYGDVVPRRDWESLDRKHRDTLGKMEMLQKDFSQMKQEYDTLLEVHRQLAEQREGLQAELERFRGSSTPRPRWEKCADVVSGGSERWAQLTEGQSSDQLVDILLEELRGGPAKEKDFFDGLGTGEDVPVYLRYEGQIRNLKLKKSEIVNTIKEVWKDKVLEDEQKEERQNLAEFLHSFLEKRHVDGATEWAYSLVEGCRRHQDDDFISLFFSILLGKVDESVYHGQIHLLSHLLKELIHSDAAESSTLTMQEFSDALRRAFPLKMEAQIEELIQAAQAQLGSTFTYQALFTEDAEGKPGPFLKLVKKQANAEKHKYLTELRAQLGSKEQVEVADLKTAFQSIDPSLDSQILDRYLSVAFQTRSDRLEQAAPVDTDSALQRLLAAHVKRAGPLPPQD
uniref:Translin-associated factor X interacting protein 1 n=1 Tax=Lepisosteus oculatus TaxID=7918 RepID=W5MIE2_LEPOC|nr:PREDICTED: translin-associated factor X-interacting protein 1 [Lepisosteus oculatus]